MASDTVAEVARRVGLRTEQAAKAIELLDAGLDPAFIAHYRKAATGGLDESAVRHVASSLARQRRIESLREEARRLGEQAGLLDEALEVYIARTSEVARLRDVVAALKPGRRTAGAVARERGLEPLAKYILDGASEGPDLPTKAAEFVKPDQEVYAPEDALAGAGHIIAERIGRHLRVRETARRWVMERGILCSERAKRGGRGVGEFRGYFGFKEPLKHLPPHRVLALNRGEKAKALRISVQVPRDELRAEILPLVAPPGHRFREFLEKVLKDALDRLVLPGITREARRKLTERAEDHAIEVFAENLRSLLMAPPLEDTRVMALQPGFRSGCKVAILDDNGALLDETIVYPFQPQKKRDEAKATLLSALARHEVDVVAIGNGTGCRDCEELVSEIIEENDLDLVYTIVNEAGAGVYADSRPAHEEFPNLEAAVRTTVSIGRRLQNPLRELVKIDPRAIGVGLYQHDVDQEKLKAHLEATVESCVCAVGVDANAAPAPLLAYVPGVGAEQVDSLLSRRAEERVHTREDLRGLSGWDGAAFLQAAGFLRVRGPNPLDDTRVHPESYDRAERLLKHIGHSADDLADRQARRDIRDRLTGLPLEPLAEELRISLPDLLDLVAALQRPDHDPRRNQPGPIFRKRIQRIEDFRPGMWVKGTVRNVVDFGAFVDIGLKEDGLIHISQFSRRYVRNPLKFLHVGDVVDARIVRIDADRHRISLTLIPEEEPKRSPPRRKPPTAEGPGTEASKTSSEPSGKKTAPAAAQSKAESPPRRAGGTADDGEGQSAPPPERRARGRGGRRAASGDRGPRRGSGRGGPRRDSGPRRSQRDRSSGRSKGRGGRPSRSKHPRVHTFRDSTGKPSEPDLDEQGRPKIRWAWYDSDEEEKQRQEEESFEEEQEE